MNKEIKASQFEKADFPALLRSEKYVRTIAAG